MMAGGGKTHVFSYANFLVLVLHLTSCDSFVFPERGGHDYRQQQQESETQDIEVHCSRPRSRIAREVINEYLVPFLEQQQYNLSTTCRLHPANDMFQEQEQQKDTLRPTQWQCGYCKKLFRSEEFLDKHFDNRHFDKLDIIGTTGSGLICVGCLFQSCMIWIGIGHQNRSIHNNHGHNPNRCVADICGALHCDYVDSQTKISKKRICNSAAVNRNKHLCESLANSCFPPEESSTALRLHEFFLHQFCDAHTCNRGQKHFPRGSGKPKNRALYFAVSLFTIILLLIFYVAVYLHRRDMLMNATNLKRLAKHSVLKSQGLKSS